MFEQKEEDEWIIEAKVEILKLTEEWFVQYLGRRANAISRGSGERIDEQTVQGTSNINQAPVQGN